LSPPVTILATVAGVLLIASALRDVFDTLFHPGGRAALSRGVMRIIWRALKPAARRRKSLISLAGPLMVVAIIGCWAASLIVGWALIYWPHMDDSFAFTAGRQGSFLDAVYISSVTLSTVGFGDITPSEGWLRVVSPFEALLGFGLLTASISWLGSIYPAVQRRRALAYEIYLLREAQDEAEIALLDLEADSATAVYMDLITRIVTGERDMVTFPISYYFSQNDDRFSLSLALPYVWELAVRGSEPEIDERVRLRAVMLRDAVGDFGGTIAERFHGHQTEDTAELLAAYARDHLKDPGEPVQAP
jgi:hypothetical protein